MLSSTFSASLFSMHKSSAEDRRRIQSIASEILGASKRAIFAMQRGDRSASAAEVRTAAGWIKKGRVLILKRKRLAQEGIWRSALEEYAEAALYHAAMSRKPVGFLKEIPKDETEIYLGAISDLSGELTRSCVLAATRHDKKEVERLAEGVRDIVAFLIKLDLTGNLRQKYDQAKQNLRKIEEIALGLAMRIS